MAIWLKSALMELAPCGTATTAEKYVFPAASAARMRSPILTSEILLKIREDPVHHNIFNITLSEKEICLYFISPDSVVTVSVPAKQEEEEEEDAGGHETEL